MLTATWCVALLLAAAQPGEAPTGGRVIVGVVPGDAPFADPALDGILDAGFGGTTTVAEVHALSLEHDLVDRMEWARSMTGDDVRAVYWVEPVDAQRHRLYLFDPRTEQIWVRSLPQGSDPADVLDTLAAMVRSLTEGMPTGDPRGMQRIEAAPQQPTPTPQP
ncbi:MAG: hypothetical protein IAG13_03485, partial [Deltaproteobacteria bacterium]|nr:hypothetical protein [Nannocystaceae bacterium]